MFRCLLNHIANCLPRLMFQCEPPQICLIEFCPPPQVTSLWVICPRFLKQGPVLLPKVMFVPDHFPCLRTPEFGYGSLPFPCWWFCFFLLFEAFLSLPPQSDTFPFFLVGRVQLYPLFLDPTSVNSLIDFFLPALDFFFFPP